VRNADFLFAKYSFPKSNFKSTAGHRDGPLRRGAFDFHSTKTTEKLSKIEPPISPYPGASASTSYASFAKAVIAVVFWF